MFTCHLNVHRSCCSRRGIPQLPYGMWFFMNLVTPRDHHLTRCLPTQGYYKWRDGNHSMHMPPYHMLMWLAYIHVLCTVQALPRSAASPICLALLESCRSAVLRSHHHPLAPPMCVCMSVGGCPSSRGTQALWCRAECEKSLTTRVSLGQDSLLPRAARY